MTNKNQKNSKSRGTPSPKPIQSPRTRTTPSPNQGQRNRPTPPASAARPLSAGASNPSSRRSGSRNRTTPSRRDHLSSSDPSLDEQIAHEELLSHSSRIHRHVSGLDEDKEISSIFRESVTPVDFGALEDLVHQQRREHETITSSTSVGNFRSRPPVVSTATSGGAGSGWRRGSRGSSALLASGHGHYSSGTGDMVEEWLSDHSDTPTEPERYMSLVGSMTGPQGGSTSTVLNSRPYQAILKLAEEIPPEHLPLLMEALHQRMENCSVATEASQHQHDSSVFVSSTTQSQKHRSKSGPAVLTSGRASGGVAQSPKSGVTRGFSLTPGGEEEDELVAHMQSLEKGHMIPPCSRMGPGGPRPGSKGRSPPLSDNRPESRRRIRVPTPPSGRPTPTHSHGEEVCPGVQRQEYQTVDEVRKIPFLVLPPDTNRNAETATHKVLRGALASPRSAFDDHSVSSSCSSLTMTTR